MTSKEIQKVLQHQYPFIMVDKIIDIEDGKKVKGIKNVSINEPWVQGHFPDNPIFPGVLIIETMAQVSGFAFYNPDDKNSELKGYLCRVNKVKLIQKVVPGDVLIIDAEVSEKFGKMVRVKCTASVEEKTVAVGVLTYVLEQ